MGKREKGKANDQIHRPAEKRVADDRSDQARLRRLAEEPFRLSQGEKSSLWNFGTQWKTPRGRSEILNLEQEVNSLGVENERKHQCQAEALLRPVPRTASGRLHISRCPSASSSQSSDVSHSFLYTGLPPCLLCRWLPLSVCASRHDHSPVASTNDLMFSRPDSVRAVNL